jgi:hypothetical protein
MPPIPPLCDALWDKLVSGRITHKFTLFAANMALARAVRLVAADPAQQPVQIAELHQFCTKYAAQIGHELQTLR